MKRRRARRRDNGVETVSIVRRQSSHLGLRLLPLPPHRHHRCRAVQMWDGRVVPLLYVWRRFQEEADLLEERTLSRLQQPLKVNDLPEIGTSIHSLDAFWRAYANETRSQSYTLC